MHYELKVFLLQSVKADCTWASWSDFEPCSNTCGEGIQSRKRVAQNAAVAGGSPCTGTHMDARRCNIRNCYGAALYHLPNSERHYYTY